SGPDGSLILGGTVAGGKILTAPVKLPVLTILSLTDAFVPRAVMMLGWSKLNEKLGASATQESSPVEKNCDEPPPTKAKSQPLNWLAVAPPAATLPGALSINFQAFAAISSDHTDDAPPPCKTFKVPSSAPPILEVVIAPPAPMGIGASD